MNRIDIVNKVNQEHQLKDYWRKIVEIHNVAPNRQRKNVMFRHAFFVVTKQLSGLSLQAIGRLLSKDHATVLHAVRQHETNMKFDSMYRKIYQNMWMDITDLLITDVDFFSQEGLKDENNQLRERLIKLSKMNRDLIIEKNKLITDVNVMKDQVEEYRESLSKEQVKNSLLNKKLNNVVW